MKRLLKYPFAIYTILALAIMGPLLLPGYVLTFDMVFGPHVKLPDEITASYPFYLLLKLLSLVIPSWIIQKLMLLSILILSGLAAHRFAAYLLRHNPSVQWGAYFAGLLYVINPFTYVRFMDGHFAVLLGYAVLPFFSKALFELLFDKKYTYKQAVRTALYVCICIVFSIHAIGPIAILSLVAIGTFVMQQRRTPRTLVVATKYLAVAVAVLVALNSYWIAPILLGTTPRETLIQNFDMRHFLSFRTDGATDLGVISNVLSMHGYWGDREGRYTLPQTSNPAWPIFFVTILALSIYGLYRIRHSPRSIALTVSAIIAVVLAIGVAATPFNYLTTWLVDYLPFFRGFREPQKLISIVALFYAITGGAGIAYLHASSALSRLKSDHRALLSIVFIIPFLYTPTFLGGFTGQLHSSEYPADWASADTAYLSRSEGKILFLPWHQYMYFDFAGRVITHPAPVYFGNKAITSDSVEIGLIHRQTANPTSGHVEQALAGKDPHTFAQMLNTLHIEYVVLGKNADWNNYAYLDDMPLQLVRDSETLKIYRNTSLKQQF